MAKRQKIGGGSAMENAYQVQELLTIPEAEKLRKLNDDMSSILKRKSNSIDERVRSFEEKLAEYRQVQDKIIKRGGVSLTAEPADTFDLESPQYMASLKSIVGDIIADKQITGHQAAEQGRASSPATVWSTPLSYSADKQSSRRQLLEKTDKTVEEEEEKPPAAAAPPSKKGDSARKVLNSLLKRHGVVWTNEEIQFPLENPMKKTKRKNTMQYKHSTYDKVLNFLLADELTTMPYQTSNLVDLIYKNMKSEMGKGGAKFEEFVEKYPNLKNVHDIANVINVNAWSTDL
jgi:hypothetical protein